MLEEEEVEVPVSATSEVPKDATKMDTDDAPRDDDNMQEPKGASDTADGAAENGAGDSEEKTVPMDTDTKVSFFYYIVDDTCTYMITTYIDGPVLAACYEELLLSGT
jgi:hypothetical protein